jgi:hypothetical protein
MFLDMEIIVRILAPYKIKYVQYVLFLVVLRFELLASRLLGRPSTFEHHL